MFIAALLVIPVVVIEASHVSSTWKTFGLALNWVVWTAFAVELVVMLAVSPSRMAWLRSHPLEAAIVVLTPPFLPASLGALRLFRLLRLLRLLVVVKETRRLFTVDGMRLAAVLAGIAALGGGAIFSAVEAGHHSVWDGTWWAITTMSTVGYGDFVPKTVIGRAVAVALMFVGVGFFALVTGAVAQRFLAGEIEQADEAIVDDVEEVRADVLRELHDLSERLATLERKIARL